MNNKSDNLAAHMTIRESIAAQCLQGLLACPEAFTDQSVDQSVAMAIECADKLIAELEKQPQK